MLRETKNADRPKIPDELRQMMARIGPIWASDTGGHVALMVEAFSAVLASVKVDPDILVSGHAYGPHPRQHLDVYRHRDTPPGAPGIIFIHGGTFTEGSANRTPQIYANVARYFAGHGMVGINAGYRLAPDAVYPQASHDVGAAVALLHARAPEFGIDPARLFLMGHSAGGAHVGSYAYDRDLHPPGGCMLAGLIVISGRMRADNRKDNPNARRVEAYYGTNAHLFDARSPVSHIGPDSVPSFIAFAEYENPLIDVYCLELAHRLAAATGRAPPILRLARHNHTSIIGHIGTAEDILGAAIRGFVQQHSQQQEH